MESLNLYKDRQPYEVILEVKGGKKKFKIPNELTIEESERLLEAEIQIMALSKQEAGDDKDDKIEQYFKNLYQYLLILFNRYQPEIKLADIKKMMSQAEAIRVLEFFKNKRFLHLIGADEESAQKKKPKTPLQHLEELRHSITSLVDGGFSLTEVRKLYLDEFVQYSNSLIYIKERKGEIKKGTYDRIKNGNQGTVASLKSQLFKIKPNGN